MITYFGKYSIMNVGFENYSNPKVIDFFINYEVRLTSVEGKMDGFNPSTVEAKALYAGLSVLVKLANRIDNETTKTLCESIRSTWAELGQKLKEVGPRTSEGVALLQNVEPNLRKLYLDIVWRSTERYGNREQKRVRGWREGTVGPLNSLLNFAGAVMRDLAVTRYPFPEPAFFQVREYRDGSIRVLPQSLAERTPLDDVRKSYWRAGYKGSGKRPMFLLSHPTLPELDFIDMIRAHVIELCRQCFIHNVPSADAHAYIRFLVHRLKPFLDWVYTAERAGRKNFWPDADKELRRLVREIRTLYGRNVGRRERATESLDEIPVPQTVHWLKNKASQIISNTDDEEARKKCTLIAKMIDEGMIGDRDVEKLMNRATDLVRKEGNDWHRVLFSGLHHPQSLRSVVFSGDTMLEKPGHVIVVAELPLRTPQGVGQADLTIFVRRRVSGQTIWTPVMILELKTRTSIDFSFYSQESRTKHDMLPVPYLWKTALSEEEWDEAVGSIPPRATLDQLDLYERGVLREYHELVPEDPDSPCLLKKGVVLIDTQENQSSVVRAFEEMIDHLKANLRLLGSNQSGWVSYVLETRADTLERPPRLSVILCPSKGSPNPTSGVSPLERVSVGNPFEFRVKDDRHLAVCVSVSSPTSFGPAAAWISTNWHLLRYLNESVSASEVVPRVVWVDLVGDFPTAELIKARFRVETPNRKRNAYRDQDMSRLLDSITFVEGDSEVASCILGGKKPKFESLKSIAKNADAVETVFVIGGWAEMVQLVPARCRQVIGLLESALLSVLPKSNTSIIWTDEGTSHSRMSSLYQRRCVNPLPYDSLRRSQVDEVIWNIPMAPRIAGGASPRRTDVRIIVQDTPTSAAPFVETVRVPHLTDWARRFRGLSGGKKTVKHAEILETALVSTPLYNRIGSSLVSDANPFPFSESQAADMLSAATALAPSLLRLRGGTVPAKPTEAEASSWQVVEVRMASGDASLISDRFHLRPERPAPTPGKSEKPYRRLSEATRGWMYGSIPSPGEKTNDWHSFSRRPPLTGTAEQSAVDSLQTRKMELRRLLSAVDFLKKKVSPRSDLWNCCHEISRCCRRILSVRGDRDALLEGLRETKKLILDNTEREVAWRLLYQARQSLLERLDPEHRETLRKAMESNEDLLSLYGNNLFLAVYAAAEKTTQDTASQSMLQLWQAVAEWQLYQMGFKSQRAPKQTIMSRYDFQAMYSNLLWRANSMKNLLRSKPVQLVQRFGQALWQEQEDGFNIWLVFPEKTTSRLVGALVVGQESLDLRLSWYRCIIDPEQLRMAAGDALRKWGRTPILLASLEDKEFLWMKAQEEDGEGWSFMGVIEYGAPPAGKTFPVRWLKFSAPSPEVYEAIYNLTPGQEPSSLNESVNRLLKVVKSWRGTVKDVKCIISIDVKQQAFRVEYRDATGLDAETLVVRTTQYTDEVISFLKEPSLLGKYPATDEGTLLRWDPNKDIEYRDVVVRKRNGEREWFSTTFLKPLARRRSFLHGCYHLPRTCRELLETKEVDNVTLVVSVDEHLKKLGIPKHLRVVLDGLDQKSPLRCIERIPLGIYDVALLAECEQIVDVGMKTRHELDIDVKGLGGNQVPLGIEEYERLSNAIASDIDESYEESAEESPLPRADKSAKPTGPELALFGVESGTKSKGLVLTVTAHFGETGDTELFTSVLVIELSKETAKARALDYESLAGEVVEHLSGLNVSDNTMSETVRLAIEALREEGVDVSE